MRPLIRRTRSMAETPSRRAGIRERRLLAPETVKELARVLAPGGELRFASDDGDYAAQALVLIGRSGVFEWAAIRPADWRERPADWPETRYERKAVGAGRKSIYLKFVRMVETPEKARILAANS